MRIRIATLVTRALAEVCTVAVLIVITITNTNISEAQNVAITADLEAKCSIGNKCPMHDIHPNQSHSWLDWLCHSAKSSLSQLNCDQL